MTMPQKLTVELKEPLPGDVANQLPLCWHNAVTAAMNMLPECLRSTLLSALTNDIDRITDVTMKAVQDAKIAYTNVDNCVETQPTYRLPRMLTERLHEAAHYDLANAFSRLDPIYRSQLSSMICDGHDFPAYKTRTENAIRDIRRMLDESRTEAATLGEKLNASTTKLREAERENTRLNDLSALQKKRLGRTKAEPLPESNEVHQIGYVFLDPNQEFSGHEYEEIGHGDLESWTKRMIEKFGREAVENVLHGDGRLYVVTDLLQPITPTALQYEVVRKEAL